MSSAESIRANEALLEKMLELDTSKPWDPQTAILSGKSSPNPTDHPDSRMRLELKDAARFYDPPQKPFTGTLSLVTKRMHKSQAETEKDEKVL
jgi:hypothetical protein